MICDKLVIRDCINSDQKSIRKIIKSSFGREAEANFVAINTSNTGQTISLIAECDGQAVGHILMAEIDAPCKAMTIAPLAVIPKYREMQVGSQLIRQALRIAKEKDMAAIFASGDPLYYERFGFSIENAKKFNGSASIANKGPKSSRLIALDLKPEVFKCAKLDK